MLIVTQFCDPADAVWHRIPQLRTTAPSMGSTASGWTIRELELTLTQISTTMVPWVVVGWGGVPDKTWKWRKSGSLGVPSFNNQPLEVTVICWKWSNFVCQPHFLNQRHLGKGENMDIVGPSRDQFQQMQQETGDENFVEHIRRYLHGWAASSTESMPVIGSTRLDSFWSSKCLLVRHAVVNDPHSSLFVSVARDVVVSVLSWADAILLERRLSELPRRIICCRNWFAIT